MTLPSGTHFAAHPDYVSGASWVSTDGQATATVSDGTLASDGGGRYHVAPGPDFRAAVSGVSLGVTDTAWGVYWVGRYADLPATLHHLVAARSVALDQAWGLNWGGTGVQIDHRGTGGYESQTICEFQEIDDWVLLTGAYVPGTGFVFGAVGHPDYTAAANPAYAYAAAHTLVLGGRDDGWGPQAAGVRAWGYRASAFTRADRLQLLAHFGLTDPRTTYYGDPGVGGDRRTLLGGTVTTTVRVLDDDPDTAELEVTREGGTCPTGGAAVLDGFRDWESAGSRVWGGDDWAQGVYRADVSGLADGTHRVDVAFRSGDTTYGIVDDLPLVVAAGNTPPAVAAFGPLGLGAVPPHVDRYTGRARATYDPDRSVLVVCPYILGVTDFRDGQYGSAVRDECLAAGLGVEFGVPFEFNETGGAYPTFAAYWAATAGLRAQYEQYFTRWPGPVVLTGDNWFYDPTGSGGGIAGCPMKVWHDRGWMTEACQTYVAWLDSVARDGGGVRTVRAEIYRDEFQYPFGADPDADPTDPATAPGLRTNNFNGPAPVAAMVAAWRAAGGCAVMPGNTTVNVNTPVGWDGWTMGPDRDRYADGIAQYHSPGQVGPDPWTPLPASFVTMGYAARQRDPDRLFSLNTGATVVTYTKSAAGPQVSDVAYVRGGAWRPESVGAQIWIALGFGATIIRPYLVEPYWYEAYAASAPNGTYLQRSTRPGTAAWDALRLHATVAREYTPYILQPEAGQPAALPREWFCWARRGNGVQFACVVNVSEAAQPFPAAFPVAGYAAAEVVGLTRTAVPPRELPGRSIPAGAAVLLTGDAVSGAGVLYLLMDVATTGVPRAPGTVVVRVVEGAAGG